MVVPVHIIFHFLYRHRSSLSGHIKQFFCLEINFMQLIEYPFSLTCGTKYLNEMNYETKYLNEMNYETKYLNEINSL